MCYVTVSATQKTDKKTNKMGSLISSESPGSASRIYKIFPKVPGVFMNPPAFVTELMGLTFYHHLDALFDDILADEPETKQRCRELLHEIMVDELAHVGQRRNFIGPVGQKLSANLAAG